MYTVKIHDFAQRWIAEFQAENIHSAEQLLGKECDAVGFVMDMGASLKQYFPEFQPFPRPDGGAEY